MEKVLDEDQQKIVELTNGVYGVYACPGAGKSRVILYRAANLVKQGSVLSVSFTNESAKSLRIRAGQQFPSMDTSCFSTMHSLALKFAYDNQNAFSFKLADNPLAVDGLAAKAVYEATGNKINYSAFVSWVSLQKRLRNTPPQAIAEALKSGVKLEYALAWKNYQNSLKKSGLLDFDDLLTNFVDILETRPDIRSNYQWDFVQVDEAQDLSELEWRLIQLITMKNRSLLAVGDANQNIYGFRGSSSEHFLNIQTMFPEAVKLYMGRNYRSTKSIVSAVKTAAPYQDIAEHFYAVSAEEGVVPSVTAYSTDYREAEEVVNRIRTYGPESCAVLCRTNLGLREIEEECINKNVQYHLLGNSGFWEAPEVQAVLAYVRCAVSPTDHAVASAIRTPFHPSRFLRKKVVIDQLKTLSEKYGISYWEALDKISGTSGFKDFLKQMYKHQYSTPIDAMASILKDLKAFSHYQEEENLNPDRNPVANLKELIRVASRYDNLRDFLEFVRKIQFVSREKKGVCLSTIHSAKGREWPNVFVISVNEGVLPHKNATDLGEEKNCFYVAVSRAEKTLHLSFYDSPSRFLKPFMEIHEQDTIYERAG